MGLRSRITGSLICGAVGVALASLRFSASVVQRMLEHAGSDLPRPAVLALAVTRSWILIPFLLFCIAVVAVSEVRVRTEAHRLLLQIAVLLLLVLLLAFSAWGFFISFYIPGVRID